MKTSSHRPSDALIAYNGSLHTTKTLPLAWSPHTVAAANTGIAMDMKKDTTTNMCPCYECGRIIQPHEEIWLAKDDLEHLFFCSEICLLHYTEPVPEPIPENSQQE